MVAHSFIPEQLHHKSFLNGIIFKIRGKAHHTVDVATIKKLFFIDRHHAVKIQTDGFFHLESFFFEPKLNEIIIKHGRGLILNNGHRHAIILIDLLKNEIHFFPITGFRFVRIIQNFVMASNAFPAHHIHLRPHCCDLKIYFLGFFFCATKIQQNALSTL